MSPSTIPTASLSILLLVGVVTAPGCYRDYDYPPGTDGGATATAGGAPTQADAGSGARDAAAGESGIEPSTCLRSQAVLFGTVTNARELGGTPTASGTVACGKLYRGSPLSNLTAEGCAKVAALGIRTVVDLRVESERSSIPNAGCVSAENVNAPLPIPYSVDGPAYLADLNTTSSIAELFRRLADPAAYPLYFHCTYGRDRSGVVAAVILLALGVSQDDVMRDYLLSQTSVGAYPSALQAVLDDIERRGGIDAYLENAGVPAEHVAMLRAQALTP